jgi:hypothetical protein
LFLLSQQEDLEAFASVVAGLVGGSIDFIGRRGGEKNLRRLGRLEWWSRVLERLGSVVLRNLKRVRRVEKSREWIETSVSASLGMIRKAVGEREYWEWLEAIVDTGVGNLKKFQEDVVSQYWADNGQPVEDRAGHVDHMETPF